MHRSIDNSLSSTCPQHFIIEWPFCGTSHMWTVEHEISADICRHSSRDEQLQWDHCTRPKPRTQPAGEQLSIERGRRASGASLSSTAQLSQGASAADCNGASNAAADARTPLQVHISVV